MRINTNINAMTALNQSTKNTALAGNSMAKLSSGLRINKSGDDAAGLAISEKMRSQIRGMEQAERNTQDGVSLVQTAEGAMEEIGNIGQRMRELTVQASNETNSVEDREKIAEELKQLHSEIDRIADTTEFNGKKLLTGNITNGSTTGETSGNVKIDTTIKLDTSNLIGTEMTGSPSIKVQGNLKDIGVEDIEISFADGASNNEITITLKDKNGNAISSPTSDTIIANTTAIGVTDLEFTFNDVAGTSLKDSNGTAINLKLSITESGQDTLKDKTITGKVEQTITPVYDTNISFGNTNKISTITYDKINGNFEELGIENVRVAKDADNTGKLALELLDKDGKVVGSANNITDGAGEQTIIFKDSNGNTLQDLGGNDISIDVELNGVQAAITGDIKEFVGKFNPDKNITSTSGKEMALDFQVGANSNQSMEVKIGNVKTENLGLNLKDIEALTNKDLKAGTEAANAYIEKIDSALETVNTYRANLGAYQNRLEYAQNNLTTSNENLTAAESRIRDVDVAKEMMNLSKLNLLNQASQAMMSQAKSQPEGVMQLLR